MDLVFDHIWVDEFTIGKKIKNIMDEAITTTPKWEIVPDYKAMLEAVKLWMKLKKRWPETIVALPMMFWNTNWWL